MPQPTPSKCLQCAFLEMDRVRSLHGPEGDRCYQRSCDSKRSRIRKKDEINLKRRTKKAIASGKIEIDHPNVAHATLNVWREDRAFSPVHAIGATIWQEDVPIAVIDPIHCAGYLPAQVEQYVESILGVIHKGFHLKRFENQVIQPPHTCPLSPCPLHGFPRIT
jgi:hypothetical protein